MKGPSVTLLSRLPGQSVGPSVIRLILFDTNKKARWVLLSLLALLSLRAHCCVIYQPPLSFPASPTMKGEPQMMAANHRPGAPSSSWHLALQEASLGDLSVEPCTGVCWSIATTASSLPKTVCLDDLDNMSSGFCQGCVVLCLSFLIWKWK